MKRSTLIFGLLLMLMLVGVFAVEAPDMGVGGGDVENIQGVVGNYSPLDEEGNINLSKYDSLKSKAEQRIEKINLWIEENASWLEAVFGMVPSLSTLFVINLYLIILYLVILVFNGDILAGWFSVLDKKIDLVFFETRWSNVVGFIFFVGLIVTKALVLLAKFGEDLFIIFWDYVLSFGLVIAIILVILIIVGLVVVLIFAPQVLQAIGQIIEKRKKKKEAKKEEVNRKVLDKVIEGVTGE